MASSVNYNSVEFIKSAADRKQFIRSSVPSVVFAGKSNVGKSSAINRVLNRKNFAHVGSTPGKTVHVNYFLVDKKLYLVDLPGYGFANVAREEKERWSSLMEAFFAEKDLMTMGVLIVDARHSPSADDVQMAQWFLSSGCPFLVLANKTDKLKKSELEKNLPMLRAALSLPEETELISFSAVTGQGRETLLSAIGRTI